jgi:predicted transposase YdaD
MPYVTSFERDAKEEGIVIGKEIGVVEGMEIGKEIGVVKGMEIGKEIGVVKGVEIGRLEVARKLMASGFSAEQVASIAGVPLALLV